MCGSWAWAGASAWTCTAWRRCPSSSRRCKVLTHSFTCIAPLASGQPTNHPTQSTSPHPTTPPDKKVASIAAGHSHSAALTEGGELFMWGMKLYLEPHPFKCAPAEGQSPERVVAVACGGSHTAAVSETGRLYTFGKVGSSKQTNKRACVCVCVCVCVCACVGWCGGWKTKSGC